MSSMYKILCLSHDPAIVTEDEDWHSARGGREKIEKILDDHASLKNLAPGHSPSCDLMGGQFSYPLVALYCPKTTMRVEGRKHDFHDEGRWLDMRVILPIAYLAHLPLPPAQHQERERALAGLGCWSPKRLAPLWSEHIAHRIEERS